MLFPVGFGLYGSAVGVYDGGAYSIGYAGGVYSGGYAGDRYVDGTYVGVVIMGGCEFGGGHCWCVCIVRELNCACMVVSWFCKVSTWD